MPNDIQAIYTKFDVRKKSQLKEAQKIRVILCTAYNVILEEQQGPEIVGMVMLWAPYLETVASRGYVTRERLLVRLARS
ncbi:hypothetical protein E4U09_008271 [Claviceps aff. purpurea]|uniref:Uncharacterized protein n=1 Tax=Claviceps aff. purpurea TaxID=1967640 RepID=A0A9P7U7K1_9HYPO|nr:hypothetical protein E4U09_008271 [Claviceps aff. purpurea]